MTERSVQDRILDWVGQQALSTVLLLALICVVVWGINVVIPDHLRMIQDGYERIEERQSAQFRAVTDQFQADQERDRQMLKELIQGGHIQR